MIKKISVMKARQNLGQIMNEVSITNDQYIIERNGKPMVAIVPISFLQKREKRKDEFLKILDKAQGNSNLSEEDAETLIQEAVSEVRKSK